MKLFYKIIFISIIISGCNRFLNLEQPPSARPTKFRAFNGSAIKEVINFDINHRVKAKLNYDQFSGYQVLDDIADSVKKINIDDPAGIGNNLITQTINFSAHKSYTLYFGAVFDSTSFNNEFIGNTSVLFPIEEQLDTPFETQCKLRFFSFTEGTISLGLTDSTGNDSTRFITTDKPKDRSQAYLSPYSLLFPGNKKIFVRGTFFDLDLQQYKTLDYIFNPVKLELGKVYTIVVTGTISDKDNFPLSAVLTEEGTDNNAPLVFDKIVSNEELLASKAYVKFIYAAANVSTWGPLVRVVCDKSIGVCHDLYLFRTLGISLNSVQVDSCYYFRKKITGRFYDPGIYTFEVNPGGYLGPPYIRQDITFEKGKGYDVLIKPGPSDAGLQLEILENERNVPLSQFKLRLINEMQLVGYNNLKVDVKIDDPSSPAVISNIPYNSTSAYVSLLSTPRAKRIYITEAGTNHDLFPDDIMLLPFTPKQSGTLLLRASSFTKEPYAYGQSVVNILGGLPGFDDPGIGSYQSIDLNRPLPEVLYFSDDGSNLSYILKSNGAQTR